MLLGSSLPLTPLLPTRYEKEHQEYLAEEAKRDDQERIKKTRKRPADRVNRLVSEKKSRPPGEDAIIDELLKDDSSDTVSMEEDSLENVAKKNSFVRFENVGFRTNGFVVKDEIVSPSETPRPAFTVPPSLPNLQKIAKPKVKEVSISCTCRTSCIS